MSGIKLNDMQEKPELTEDTPGGCTLP
uniref:Uncharacterized protein n=1 Tax=Anguilla anguilla TaxID=7936 RepID=A0A0E9UB71_ANGAN